MTDVIETCEGIITNVIVIEAAQLDRYGNKYERSIEVDDVMFAVCNSNIFKINASNGVVVKGVKVSFTYTLKDGVKFAALKSMSILALAPGTAGKPPPPPATATVTSKPKKPVSSTIGIEVGHAINNAVQIVYSSRLNDTPFTEDDPAGIDHIERYARLILDLSNKLKEELK